MRLSNIILLFAYLNEIYILGIGRIFDILIYILVLILIFLKRNFFSKKLLAVLFGLSFTVLVSFMFYLDFRLTLAMTFGLTLMILRDKPTQKFVLRLVNLHIFAFLLQMALFYVLNVHVSLGDFLPGLDVSRNLNIDLGFYRPSGLFLEPNAYVVNSAFLLIISWDYLPKRIYYILLLTVVLSKSIFGIVFVVILLFYSAKRIFKMLIVLFGLLGSFLFLQIAEEAGNSEIITFRRVNDIIQGSDASVEARLKGEESKNLTDFLVPHGIDFKNYMKLFGINGISMLIYSLGILGWILLAIIVYLSFVNVKWLVFLLTLFSYPYIAYCIFYITLRSLLNDRIDSRST
jgi:hypothetical protein